MGWIPRASAVCARCCAPWLTTDETSSCIEQTGPDVLIVHGTVPAEVGESGVRGWCQTGRAAGSCRGQRVDLEELFFALTEKVGRDPSRPRRSVEAAHH